MQLKVGMRRVSMRSLQKPPGLISVWAAFRMKLNLIIYRSTVMLQSMYR